MESLHSYYGRVPADRSRVVIDDPQELRWWCGRFGCSDLRLIEAVTQVGSTPSQVEQFLRFSASFDARSLSKPGSEKARRKTPRRSSAHDLPHEPELQGPAAVEEPGEPVAEDRH